MAYKEIIYTVEDMVATITLNRPERMNALTMTTYQEAEQAIREADADNDVRAVIVTGAGRGFCSGDDVRELPDAPSPEQLAQIKIPSKGKPTPLAAALLSFDKPLIAAVNGAAVGWGMDLALMCDIRIASDRAKFGEIYVLRGLIADIAGWLILPLIVGLSKAYEILLTGDIIDGKEAERIGLVSKTVPHDDLMPTAREMAVKMARLPPVAIRMTKEAIRKGMDYNLAALGEYHSYALRILFGTEDFREGSTSVLEKRQPVFKGR